MVRHSRTPLALLGFVAITLPLVTHRAEAAGESGASPAAAAPGQATEENKRAAQQHFARARELYQQGNYAAAKGELDLARGLDPQAKDLTFNLGTISEKLGQLDDALRYFHEYLELEGVTAAERSRAEANITRIEGVKRSAPTATATPTSSATPTPEAEPPTPRAYGRLDVWTWSAIGVSGAGMIVGTIFGVRALSTRPKDGFVTGQDGSYDELVRKADSAHTSAIVADVGFGIGIAGAAAAAILYFARPKAQGRADASGSSPRLTTGALSPAGGGATLDIGGTW